MTDARQPSRHRHHIRAVLVRLFGRPCLKQYVLWSLAVAAWAGILLGLWQCIPPLPKMTMHAGKALSLDAVSQDGTVLLATDDSYSSNDRSIHVWDVETGRQRLAIVGNWATVREVKLSPDGTVFTVLDQDDRWTLWETATGKEVPGLLEIQKDAFWVHSEKKVMSVDNRFSPDGRFLILQFHLLSNVFHYMLVFWDVETKAVRARLDGDYSELTIAKDGNQMAVCRPTKPGQFRIERWRLDADFPHAGPFQVHDVVADAIAISPTFDTFACDRASHDPEKADEIQLWDLATGRDKAKVMCFNLDQRNPRLQFSPNGQFLTADIPYRFYSVDGEPARHAPLWDTDAGLKEVSRDLDVLHFSPDDHRLLALSKDSKVELYDSATFQKRGTISVPGDWDFRPGSLGRTSPMESDLYQFAPDSKTVLMSGMLHHDHNGNPLTDFLGQYFSAFRPKHLMPSVTRLWDVESAQEIATFPDCWRALYSPNGKTLVTAHSDGTIKVWDAPPRKPVFRIVGMSLALWLSVVVGVQLWRLLLAWRFVVKQGVGSGCSPGTPPAPFPPRRNCDPVPHC